MERSRFKIKKFLIFQERETPKKFLISQETELSGGASKVPKAKISYISPNYL